MKNGDYVDLDGNTISVAGLAPEERALVGRLRGRFRSKPGWCDFRNFAMKAVGDFYDQRGIRRKKSRHSPVFAIALDLCSRLGIAEGKIAPPTFDYRENLERLVLEFPSRRAFCQAAGISQDMLSHVLAGRKNLSVEALSKALERIGYRLDFVPARKAKRTG